MDVILLERVENLGQMGDVVSVKPGYARNYLLPQKKALRANDDNKRVFEEQRAQLETDNLKLRSEAAAAAKKMDGLSVFLLRQAGDAGQLYGSVNARDIANQITEAGFTVQRRQVRMDQPIKAIGIFQIRLDLHPEVLVTVTANVARSEEEAAIQAKTGKAVLHQDEDEEEQAAAAEAVKEAARESAEQVFEAPTEEDIDEIVEESSLETSPDEASGEAAEKTADDDETDETDESDDKGEPTDETTEVTSG